MSAADGVADWVDLNWSEELTLVRAIQQVLGSRRVIGPPTGNAPNMGVPTLLTHAASRPTTPTRRSVSCAAAEQRPEAVP